MADRDKNHRSENGDGKQEALDKNRVHAFAVQYYDAYTSETADEWELQDSKFADICWALGFEMDCGNRFCETYGGYLGDVEHLEKIVDQIDDPMILGCGIFSQWRYVTHWGYGDRLLDADHRPWFIMAFRRLAALTGDPVPYREMPPSEPFKYVGPTSNTTAVTQQAEPVKETSLFDAGYAYESGQGQAKCLTNALAIYEQGAALGDQKCIEAIERLMPEGWSDDEIFLRHIREIGEDLHDLAEKLMKCASLLGIKTSYSNGPLGVYTTEVFNIAPRNRAHYEYVRLEHKISKLSVKNKISEKRVEELFREFKTRFDLNDTVMPIKRGYVHLDMKTLTDDNALAQYLVIIRDIAKFHLKPNAKVPTAAELCDLCGVAEPVTEPAQERPWLHKPFSFDSPLVQIKIVSNRTCFFSAPDADDEVEQHLTITSSGNVRLLRYTFDDLRENRHHQKEKCSFQITTEDANEILTTISSYFGGKYQPHMVTDVGYWTLILTNEKGETCKLIGSLEVQPDGDITLTEMSIMIREILHLNDLYIFDSHIKEGGDYGADYTGKYNELTTTFLKHLVAEQKCGNVVFSPASIITLLAMTALATDGTTRDEIVKALGTGMTYEETTDAISSLLRSLDDCVGYRSSSAVITNRKIGSKIKASGARAIRGTYGADLIKSDDPVTDVNAWVNNKTNGTIPSIADDSMRNMLVALINAVVFEETWQDPYDESHISKRMFKNADGSLAVAQMISGKEDQFVEDRYYEGFVKCYRNGYCYMALLPRKMGQANLLHALQYTDFTALYDSRRPASVDIRMPEYQYDFSGDLMELCKSMGIRKVFTDTADFSPLASTQLMVQGMLQKAHIELDRNGTKAAAATMEVVCGCLPTTDRKKVFLDRPFVYAIIHEESGIPIFAGVVNRL